MICENDSDASESLVMRYCALLTVLLVLTVLQLGFAVVARAGPVFSGETSKPIVPKTGPNTIVPKLGPDDAAGFEVVWFGIYKISAIRRVDDPKAPGQSRGIVLGDYAPVQDRATARVPAKAGNNFGVAFKFRNASEDSPVDYRAVWRFPKPGLTNPTNTKTFLEYESTASVCLGGVCVYGWSFSEPWEMVIGTWTLELWRGSTKLHEQVFEVVRP